MIDIGTLGGSYDTLPKAMNDAGQVVGYSYPATGPQHAFSWTPAGGITDLGTLGGSYSTAEAVTPTGQVIGSSSTPGDPIGLEHLFSWTNAGGMVDLGTLGGSYVRLWAVSPTGQVIGYATPPDDLAYHAFSWTQAGGMVDLTLGGSYSFPTAVNGTGQVIGTGYTVGDAAYHAFSWTEADGIVDLGDVYPNALNDAGQVVGCDAQSRGFVWTRELGAIDLGTLGGTSSCAVLVSANGLIAGDSQTTRDAERHAVLWIPLPYVFHGFFPPVDNEGVFNIVNAGRTIPVRFDLDGDRGLDIFAAGYPRSVAIDCASGGDVIEETVNGGQSGLDYDRTVNSPIGRYTYLWSTDRAWAGSCRQLQVRLNDGQLYTANFRFR